MDQPTLDAWKVAYQQLADILINAEKNLYSDAAKAEGGWEDILSLLSLFFFSFLRVIWYLWLWIGWRQFNVAKKEEESDEIISFYLEPADHGKLPTYLPGIPLSFFLFLTHSFLLDPFINSKTGQFISVKQFVPELGFEQPRQYSLSAAPNSKYLRISVKKEIAEKERPSGKMSNLLHAGIKVPLPLSFIFLIFFIFYFFLRFRLFVFRLFFISFIITLFKILIINS